MERRLTADELAFLAAADRGPDGRSTDVASGGGTPPWMAATLRHCSRCGARLAMATLPEENRERLACDACGFIAYVNPRLVVTTIPVTADGDVILLRRGIEPGRGWWAQPGGFLEVDETVAEAAVRETLEETGLLVVPGEIVGLYSRLEAAVVTVAFEASIAGGVAAHDARGARGACVRARRHPVARDRVQDLVPRDPRLGAAAPSGRRGPVGLPRPGVAAAAERGRASDERGNGDARPQPRSTKTFLSSVYCSSASTPRSLPIPDCL